MSSSSSSAEKKRARGEDDGESLVGNGIPSNHHRRSKGRRMVSHHRPSAATATSTTMGSAANTTTSTSRSRLESKLMGASQQATTTTTYADLSPGKHLTRSYSFDYGDMTTAGVACAKLSPSGADYDRGREILLLGDDDGDCGHSGDVGGDSWGGVSEDEDQMQTSGGHEISYDEVCFQHRSDNNDGDEEEDVPQVETLEEILEREKYEEAIPPDDYESNYPSIEEIKARQNTLDPKGIISALYTQKSEIVEETAIDWDAVITLLSDPKKREAWCHRTHFLHQLLCKGAPLEVIEVLVKGSPSLLCQKHVYYNEVFRWFMPYTPMSVACFSDDVGMKIEVAVTRYLVRETVRWWQDSGMPNAAIIRKWDEYYRAIINEDFSVGITRILLEEYPEGARAQNRTFEHCLATEFAFDCIEDEGYLEKLQMLLMAATKGSINQAVGEKPFGIPHAFLHLICQGGGRPERGDIVEVGSGAGLQDKGKRGKIHDIGPFGRAKIEITSEYPPQSQFISANVEDLFLLRRSGDEVGIFVDHFLENEESILQVLTYLNAMLPDHFRQKDERGNLPLHILLSRPAPASRNYSERTVKLLLDAFPGATGIRGTDGMLPLHLAIQNGHTAYKLVAEASPSWVFESKCPKSNLYPFLMRPKESPPLYQHMKVPCIIPIFHGDEMYDSDDSDMYYMYDIISRSHQGVSDTPGSDTNYEISLLSTEMCFEILRAAPTILSTGITSSSKTWYSSEIFKELQIERMKREQQNAKISAMERELGEMKRREE